MIIKQYWRFILLPLTYASKLTNGEKNIVVKSDYYNSNTKALKDDPRHVVVILKGKSVSQVRASWKRKTNRNETESIVKKSRGNKTRFSIL